MRFKLHEVVDFSDTSTLSLLFCTFIITFIDKMITVDSLRILQPLPKCQCLWVKCALYKKFTCFLNFLCSVLLPSYYGQNDAGLIGSSLTCISNVDLYSHPVSLTPLAAWHLLSYYMSLTDNSTPLYIVMSTLPITTPLDL